MDDYPPFDVLHPDKATVHEDKIKSFVLMQVFLARQADMVAKGLSGQYAIVRADKEIMVTATQGSALAYIEQLEEHPVYLGCIGEPKEGWVDIGPLTD